MSHTRSRHTMYAALSLLPVSVYPAQAMHPVMPHRFLIARTTPFASPDGLHIYHSSFYLILWQPCGCICWHSRLPPGSLTVPHSSLITHHSSLVVRHHSTLVIRHSTFGTRHPSSVIHHSSLNTRHSSLDIRHSSSVIHNLSLNTRHSSLDIRHSTFVTRHSSFFPRLHATSELSICTAATVNSLPKAGLVYLSFAF